LLAHRKDLRKHVTWLPPSSIPCLDLYDHIFQIKYQDTWLTLQECNFGQSNRSDWETLGAFSLY
jgi:hypothetical protein